jgi:hypothetical protein
MRSEYAVTYGSGRTSLRFAPFLAAPTTSGRSASACRPRFTGSSLVGPATHFASLRSVPGFSPVDRSRSMLVSPLDLKVFISHRDSVCDECHERLGSHAWITLAGERSVLCLSCADLDHLVFLPSGDPALTRRSRKHSPLAAVVLKWSRARKQYERQGLLVQEEALRRAEEECLEDAEIRTRRQEREAARRRELDVNYIEEFARRIGQVVSELPP